MAHAKNANATTTTPVGPTIEPTPVTGPGNAFLAGTTPARPTGSGIDWQVTDEEALEGSSLTMGRASGFKTLADATSAYPNASNRASRTERALTGRGDTPGANLSTNGTSDLFEDAPAGERSRWSDRLAKLANGWTKKFDHGLSIQANVMIGMGLVAVFEVEGGACVEVGAITDADGGVMHEGSVAQAEVSVLGGVKASGHVKLAAGVGAGIPVACAGVKGAATLALQGEAGLKAKGEVKVGNLQTNSMDMEAVPEIGAILKAELVGKLALEPFVTLGRQTFEWPIDLAQHKFAEWAPDIDVDLSGDTPNATMTNLDRVIVHPLPGTEGVTQRFIGWLSADNRAHDKVQEMQATGLLDLIDSTTRAELLASIRDGWVGDDHEGSIVDLVASESNPTQRWEMLQEAYMNDHDGRQGSARQIRAWLDGAVDDSFLGLGEDHWTRLEGLLDEGPAPESFPQEVLTRRGYRRR